MLLEFHNLEDITKRNWWSWWNLKYNKVMLSYALTELQRCMECCCNFHEKLKKNSGYIDIKLNKNYFLRYNGVSLGYFFTKKGKDGLININVLDLTGRQYKKAVRLFSMFLYDYNLWHHGYINKTSVICLSKN